MYATHLQQPAARLLSSLCCHPRAQRAEVRESAKGIECREPGPCPLSMCDHRGAAWASAHGGGGGHATSTARSPNTVSQQLTIDRRAFD